MKKLSSDPCHRHPDDRLRSSNADHRHPDDRLRSSNADHRHPDGRLRSSEGDHPTPDGPSRSSCAPRSCSARSQPSGCGMPALAEPFLDLSLVLGKNFSAAKPCVALRRRTRTEPDPETAPPRRQAGDFWAISCRHNGAASMHTRPGLRDSTRAGRTHRGRGGGRSNFFSRRAAPDAPPMLASRLGHRMKKLAILTSHPIQYHAPWFRRVVAQLAEAMCLLDAEPHLGGPARRPT
jgi:hypothetical protein